MKSLSSRIRELKDQLHSAKFGSVKAYTREQLTVLLMDNLDVLVAALEVTEERQRWMHLKRKTEYFVLAESEMQSSVPVVEGERIVTYQSCGDGKSWSRPKSEFYDGRFAPVAQSQDEESDEDDR